MIKSSRAIHSDRDPTLPHPHSLLARVLFTISPSAAVGRAGVSDITFTCVNHEVDRLVRHRVFPPERPGVPTPTPAAGTSYCRSQDKRVRYSGGCCSTCECFEHVNRRLQEQERLDSLVSEANGLALLCFRVDNED